MKGNVPSRCPLAAWQCRVRLLNRIALGRLSLCVLGTAQTPVVHAQNIVFPADAGIINGIIKVRQLNTMQIVIGGMLLGCLSILTVPQIVNAETQPALPKPDSHWMKNTKYGVFFHYLPEGPDYQKAINSFDVNAFAREMDASGAAYVFITLGQNSGFYCSPNRTYENYIGCKPNERCSKRDLPMELAKAMAKYHIRLMLYLPSRAPQQDSQAMETLSDLNEQKPAPQEFTRKWSEVIREWSLRYGDRVSGWWFDGSYNTAGWDDRDKAVNWKTWAAAYRSGNPQSLLAFNPGTDNSKAFTALCEEQDYTAGEQNEWTATPQQFPAPKGLQWQVLSFLGTNWGKADGPKKSDAEMIAYIRTVNAQGGVVTMDVEVSAEGKVYPPAMKQLAALKRALRSR